MTAGGMATPAIWIGIDHGDQDAGPQWIQMNIAHQFLEISVLLASDRFVAILKQVAVAAVESADCSRLAKKQLSLTCLAISKI